MNAQRICVTERALAAAVILGLLVALPVVAQDDMQGMEMPPIRAKSTSQPAKSTSSAPAAAASVQSMQGLPMEGMDMPAKNTAPVPNGESKPQSFQHLDAGNMIGTRPKPQGLDGMQTMDMPSMQGGRAPPDARSPDYSDGYTYGPMTGMDMADDDRQGMVMIDQLEFVHSTHGDNGAFVEGEAWYGKDFDKLWLKVEGDSSGGMLQDLRSEALWSHAVSPYWDTQLGVRHDFGEGPDRTWAVLGVQGLAPYWFETEAALYVDQGGRTAARVQFEYEELLTQRWVLQPMLEVNAYGKDDPQRGIGAGLSDVQLGLRLRYEVTRQFAPYLGVNWMHMFGHTARYARDAGEPVTDPQIVAGVHFWF